MKGLQGGIPLAVLAAAARAQVNVIGGSHGYDIGNAASIPTENSFSSSVTDNYADDHSLELKHDVHVYAPQHGHGHGHGHHKRSDHPGHTSVIDGPGGVDIGNAAEVASVNTFSSSVKGYYKDDHSVDIDKTTIIKAPSHPHYGPKGHHKERRGDKFPDVPTTVIGGPHGVDVGNSADIPTFNDFSSSVTESYTDDHSVDIDSDTVIGGHPHWRRSGPATVIDGPGGVDIGNSASIPTVNSFASSVDEDYKDDHSIKIAEDFEVYYKPPHGPGHGAVGHPPNNHARREGPTTVIDGPGGIDIGNAADIPTLNSFVSSVDESYTDDHSVDVDKSFIVNPHHRARALRQGEDDTTTVIGGADGFDLGNSFDAENVNSFDSEVNTTHDDDHSVKINSHQVITPDSYEDESEPHDEEQGEEHWEPHHEEHGEEHPEPHHEEHGQEHPEPHGEEHGEEHPEPHGEEHGQEHPEPHGEEHGEEHPEPYGEEHGEEHPEPHGEEHGQEHPEPHGEEHGQEHSEPHYEAHGEEHSEPHDEEHGQEHPEPHQEEHGQEHPEPHQEEHGQEHPEPHGEEHGQEHSEPHYEAHGEEHLEPNSHAQAEPPAPAEPGCTEVQEVVHTVTSTRTAVETQTVYPHPVAHSESQVPSHQYPAPETPQSSGDNHDESTANPPYPSEDSHSYPQSDLQYPSETSTDKYPSPQHGSFASPAPAATPIYYGSQEAPQPSSTGAYHAPVASVISVEKASSFSVIPVYVPAPSETPRTHASIVRAPSSTPGASSTRPVPTGASPAENQNEPSPSSHGSVMFTGSAGHLAPATGVFSVLCGVFALLSFIL